jgi:hypothetical protein
MQVCPLRKQRLSIALLVLSTWLFFGLTAFGQTETARLSGLINDPSGRVVASATVTILNLNTGATRNTVSNSEGLYSFPSLMPGRYRVGVHKEGFRDVVLDTLTLNIQDVVQQNFALSMGSVVESVTVTADAAKVHASDAAVGGIINERQTTELPLNGRNFTQLATLVPGVNRGIPDDQASGTQGVGEVFRYGASGSGALSVNGNRPESNNYLLDGIDNNETVVNTVVFFPPAEAIQEFRVQTSVAPAEFGRAGGGIVNVVTKSGSNAYHGSAFEFLRNDALDAKPKFAPDKLPFRRNQFGSTIGGPIIKNKLFAFGDYSGLRETAPRNVEFASVPTADFRKGDFSELLDPSRSGLSGPIQIIDPLTGTPFSGNIIPTDRLNPVALNYLNAYPSPNYGNGRVQQNYLAQRIQRQHYNDFDIRTDWNISAKDSFFARYSNSLASMNTTSRLPTLPAGTGSGENFNRSRGLVLSETHVFSPAWLNEGRFGFVRVFYGNQPPFANEALSASLGIPNANTSPLLGGGALIGGSNSQIEYSGDFGPLMVAQNTFQFSDIVSHELGRHTFRFGASVIRRQVNSFRPNRGKGFFFLNPAGSGAGTTGYETTDLLVGFVNNYSIGTPTGMLGVRTLESSFFAQDSWRVTPKLTVDLGLRYDLYTSPSEVLDRQSNFDIATGKILLAGQGGNSSSFVPLDKNNFGPRIGFAYSIGSRGKTVLRGGYGIFYTIEGGGVNYQLTQNPPLGGYRQFNYSDGYRITLSGQAPMGSTDSRLATGALPTGDLSGLDLTNPSNVTVFARLPENRTPYIQQVNLQVQHELTSNTLVSVGYIGSFGRHLTRYYNLNRQYFNAAGGTRQFPLLGDVNVQDTEGASSYNSLQAAIERKLTNGWQLLASYTYGHAIDDSTGPFDGPSPQDVRNLRAERANSSLDIRQRFVISSLYELPFGRGRAFASGMPKAIDWALGGWQVNGILTLQTGLPFTIYTPGNPGNVRPDLVGSLKTYPGNPQRYFDTTAFAPVPTNSDGVLLRPGTLGRNALVGPGLKSMDLSIFKDFPVTERVKTQFRTEFFNLTNTPQYLQPVGDMSSGDFGKIQSTRFSSERQIQFALRVSF